MSNLLTKENFEAEVINSDKRVLIRFGVDKGCGFCDKYKPVFEAFEKKHSEIKCFTISKENLRDPQTEFEAQYDIKSYPTTVAFEKGEVVGKVTGVKSEEELLKLFETLQNISDYQLQTYIFDLEEEAVKLKKQLLKTEYAIAEAQAEAHARVSRAMGNPNADVDRIKCEQACDEQCKDDVECLKVCKNGCDPEKKKELIEHLRNSKK